MKNRLIRVGGGAVTLFVVLAFVYPAVRGQRIDVDWTLIAAVVSLAGAFVADTLTQWQRRRR